MVNDMQRYMVLNKNLELDQSDKRHIIQVMKMKIGEEFEIVFDNETLSYLFCSEDGKYSYDEVIYLTKDFDNTVVVTGNKYD